MESLCTNQKYVAVAIFYFNVQSRNQKFNQIKQRKITKHPALIGKSRADIELKEPYDRTNARSWSCAFRLISAFIMIISCRTLYLIAFSSIAFCSATSRDSLRFPKFSRKRSILNEASAVDLERRLNHGSSDSS